MREGHWKHPVMTTVILFLILSMSGCDVSGSMMKYLSEGTTLEEAKEAGEKDPSAEKEGPQEVEKVRLIRVVDGDTLLAEISGQEAYVRLIGINAPESVAPDEYLEKTGKSNTDDGKAASEYVRELLSGTKEIWLEYDEERTDQYGRTLAYVWLSEDRTDVENMLNARLIMEGYAQPMTIRPNVRHEKELAALADDGR